MNTKREIQRRFGGYLLEAKSLLDSVGRTPTAADQSFVLFGRGRSGSTLLVQMLDENPAIDCLGELLRFSTFAPVAMVERELGHLSAPVRGFKLLSYQMRTLHSQAQSNKMLDRLSQDDTTIFHLQRENLLRHALSNIYANARFAYHSTDARSARESRIHVEAEDLFGWMRGSRELLDWETRWLGDLDREVISYERDLATPDAQKATLIRVSERLGVEPVFGDVRLNKVTPRDFGSFVENWDDLRDRIAGSEFADFLDRDD